VSTYLYLLYVQLFQSSRPLKNMKVYIISTWLMGIRSTSHAGPRLSHQPRLSGSATLNHSLVCIVFKDCTNRLRPALVYLRIRLYVQIFLLLCIGACETENCWWWLMVCLIESVQTNLLFVSVAVQNSQHSMCRTWSTFVLSKPLIITRNVTW